MNLNIIWWNGIKFVLRFKVGLAVRNLNLFNEALLEKWLWHFGDERGAYGGRWQIWSMVSRVGAGALLMFENPMEWVCGGRLGRAGVISPVTLTSRLEMTLISDFGMTYHLVKWDKICTPIQSEGVSCQDLNLFKEALLEKCCGVLGGEMGFMEAGDRSEVWFQGGGLVHCWCLRTLLGESLEVD